MKEFEVKLSGFYEVEKIDKETIKNNCIKLYERQNKKLKTIEFIEIRLKDYQKSGTRRKFLVHSTLGFAGTVLTSKALDWNLIKAADASLKKIDSEIKRKFIGKIQSKNKAKARVVNRILE